LAVVVRGFGSTFRSSLPLTGMNALPIRRRKMSAEVRSRNREIENRNEFILGGKQETAVMQVMQCFVVLRRHENNPGATEWPW
jgi:hypothetical protein